MSTDADGPSVQLQADLREAVVDAYTMRRPVLTHLNADTTWLLSLSLPSDQIGLTGRCRYNILVDPWLQGTQTDVASWFSTQWHAIKSSVATIAEIDVLLKDAEKLELQTAHPNTMVHEEEPVVTRIDLVVVSHEFTDHCHKSTLLEVDSHVPIIATTKAAKLISTWSHFETVIDMLAFTQRLDWRTTSITPLPRWLGVSRLVTLADSMYFHSAVVICIKSPDLEGAEAVIYTPHGVDAATFSALQSAKPPVTTLAFLHGLHDVSISFTKQLNLGAHNALKAQRLLQSRYWVGTHDEVKTSRGIIVPFLKRKAYTFLDALASESKEGHPLTEAEAQSSPPVSYVDLGSGESLLLK